MKTLDLCLVLTILSALVPPLGGQVVSAAVPGQDTGPDFRIERQLDQVRGQLQRLEESPTGLAHVERRLHSISTRLQSLERLHQLTRRGHPIRTQAQLHSRLGFLKAELHDLARDLDFQFPAEPQAPATGNFSGRVTGSDAPIGLVGVSIDIYDSGGDWVASATTVGGGSYITPGLSPGDYYARTNEMTRYINELYDDVPCYFICNVIADGLPITVAESSTTEDIDFELELGNTIAGTITDAAVLPPDDAIEFVTVDFFDESGQWVTNPSSDVSGNYVTPGMPSGTYFAVTFNLDQYLNERYDDQLCVGRCDPTAGTEIEIIPGIDTVGIDFELVKGGSISGLVTADPAGTAIENVVVEIYESNGDWRGTGWTDMTGNYITGGGLPASATYRALTFAPPPYLNELYDNLPCYTGCDLSLGTPIVVALGVETPGKNFALPSGGTFSGLVSNGSTGLVGVGIEIFDTAGNWVNIAYTNGAGSYISAGLPAGNYHALTWNDQGLINELYDNIPCFFCDVTTGALIEVTGGGADHPGIDFILDSGGTFSGTVTDSDTTGELEAVIVDIFDSGGDWIANPSTDNLGHYATPGLPTGDYYARTWNTIGYVNELYDDMHCPPTCDPVSSGTTIGVTLGIETPGIDFALDKGGTLSGTITDSGSGAPIEGMTVEVWDANGDFANAAVSNPDGSYQVQSLPAGTYFASTWNALGYFGALYDGFQCADCSEVLGTPIVVAANTTTPGIEFDLTLGGHVAGTVTATGSGSGIADIHVEIWSAAGHLVAWEATRVDGSYATTWALPRGSYYVKTWNDQGYINEIHSDTPCAVCDATEGAAISIVGGATTAGIDFELASGGSISGTLTLADPNDAILTSIQIFDANGDQVWSQRPPTTSGEYTINVGLPTGTYYARTAGGRPYVNEVWNNEPCPYVCDLVNVGDPITVTAPNTTAGIDFNLEPGVKLSGTIKDANTLLAIDDSLAEIFNPAGERVSGCRVGSAGNFTCWQAIPTGTYYAATMNYDGYIDELYSDPRMTCLGGSEFCDVTQGTPIAVDVAVTPDEIHFILDRGGWFEGSLIDARWQRGLPGTGILVYDNVGDLVAEVSWKRPLSQVSAGPYSTCGLPTGTYYAVTDTSTTGGHHTNELYHNWLCFQGCDILDGTPISVNSGSGTLGIDFTLEIVLFADDLESADTGNWSRTIP